MFTSLTQFLEEEDKKSQACFYIIRVICFDEERKKKHPATKNVSCEIFPFNNNNNNNSSSHSRLLLKKYPDSIFAYNLQKHEYII